MGDGESVAFNFFGAANADLPAVCQIEEVRATRFNELEQELAVQLQLSSAVTAQLF